MASVLDLSKWNTVTDFNAISKNVDGVILRCGYRGGSTGALTTDPVFFKYMNGLVNAGVKVGVYFFTTAINTSEGAQEAAYVYNLIKKYKISFPVFIDSEMSNSNKSGRSDKLSKADRTDAIVGFCDKIEKLGYTAGIYASDSWFNSQLDFKRISKYKLWVAKYSTSSPKYVNNYVGWQYTSNGIVSGVAGRVDLSHWYESIGENTPIIQKGNPYLTPTVNLKLGSKGQYVFWLQYELNEEGYNLDVDGDFGNNTDAAVRDYQDTHGLKKDGIVGSITRNALINNIPKVDKEPDKVKNKFVNGSPIILDKINLYRNSATNTASKVISGTYYIWNNSIINGKFRICRSKEDISKPVTSVIGWVKYSDIADQFE